VFNAWPWFRSGKSAAGGTNIHSDFSKVPSIVDWADELVKCLRPNRIATLGAWAYDTPSNLSRDISLKRQSWFIRNFLGKTVFRGLTADDPRIRQFSHPALASSWRRRPVWFAVTPGYGPLLNNQDAFVDFLR
jgi:hypothetical protein